MMDYPPTLLPRRVKAGSPTSGAKPPVPARFPSPPHHQRHHPHVLFPRHLPDHCHRLRLRSLRFVYHSAHRLTSIHNNFSRHHNSYSPRTHPHVLRKQNHAHERHCHHPYLGIYQCDLVHRFQWLVRREDRKRFHHPPPLTTATYTLSCKGGAGDVVTKNVTVSVVEPVVTPPPTTGWQAVPLITAESRAGKYRRREGK